MKKQVSIPLWVLLIAVIGALVFGAAAGASGKKNDTASTSSSQPTATVTATTTATVTKAGNVAQAAAPVTVTMTKTETPAPTTPTTAASGFSDGTYIVGTDIKPGTYKSPGPAPDGIGLCYWEEDKNTTDALSKIVDNNNSKGQSVINIPASGVYSVTFTGCQPFVKS